MKKPRIPECGECRFFFWAAAVLTGVALLLSVFNSGFLGHASIGAGVMFTLSHLHHK
jgi:hypothetical protein